MKKLPIELNNQVNGECWTFYKLSIMLSSPIAKQWLATHMEFYINENFCGGYSNADCEYYHMRYFQDVFDIHKIPVMKTPPEKIVKTIISEIDSGNYVVLYLNFRRFFGIDNKVTLHELLLHGYDENQGVFYAPYLVNGRFEEAKVSFELIEVAYKDAYFQYLQDGWSLLGKRTFFFGISSIHVRDDYKNDNWFADYINKIDHEIHGRKIVQTQMVYDITEPRICYTGLACYCILSEIFMEKGSKDGFNEKITENLIRSLKMLHDHKALFAWSVEWFINQVGGQNNSELVKVLADYNDYTTELERCCLMLCKYDQTKKSELLISISKVLQKQLKNELETLLNYRKQIWPYYYADNGVPMPPDDD